MTTGASESAVVARLRTAGCVFAEDEARLLIAAARGPGDLAEMVDRRVAGLPLEHVLGWAEFCGLRVAVGPGVFVPRRRSEFLVRQAVASMTRADDGSGWASAREQAGAGAVPIVVDLCCGCGAVGLAVATALARAELHRAELHRAERHGAERHGAELHAADIDPAAIAYARRNLAAIGGQVHEGDLYGPLPASLRGRVDVLVVNAPYVPTSEIELMPSEARLHEPLVALDGGPDGVGVHRRVAAQAPGWLAAGGCLLIETSDRQASLTSAAMAAAGLSTTITTNDMLDATVVIGRLSP